jgi:phospholipid-binding lipoprotein MlaA
MMRTMRLAVLVMLVLGGGVAGAADDDAGNRDPDPWESFNRAMFGLNDGVDRWVLEPVATGYDFVVPDPVERSVSRFFQNLRVPINSVNGFLQGKPVDGASDIGRFLVNTTIGVAGFFDFATRFGLERHDEDFGQTLAVWGVPQGPYVVWPVLGASTVRDTGGGAVDTAMSIMPFFLESYVTIGARVFETVNARSLVREEIDNARSAALDFYVFVRSAYLQRREALIRDEKDATRETDDAIYFPESTPY